MVSFGGVKLMEMKSILQLQSIEVCVMMCLGINFWKLLSNTLGVLK
jgi:hypothetical protein